MWKKTEIIAFVGLLLVIIVPGLSTKAFSQVEPYGVYEDWKNPEIRADRWKNGKNDDSLEVKREIHGNRLEMRYRVMGQSIISQNRLSTKNPSTITQIEADFKVVSLSVENCDNNSFTKVVPALIDLALFNDGSSSSPVNATGDYFARVLARRNATSIDPDGMLTVDAYLYHCVDPGCGTLGTIQYIEDMGRVRVGKKFTLRIIWDKLQNKIFVGLNDDDVILSYIPVPNFELAQSPFSSIRMRMELGSCQSPIEAEATTQVREIRTNISAVIP